MDFGTSTFCLCHIERCSNNIIDKYIKYPKIKACKHFYRNLIYFPFMFLFLYLFSIRVFPSSLRSCRIYRASCTIVFSFCFTMYFFPDSVNVFSMNCRRNECPHFKALAAATATAAATAAAAIIGAAAASCNSHHIPLPSTDSVPDPRYFTQSYF